MSTLYLHIGTSKTGTTAIQCFLADNRKLLRERGYGFPIFNCRFEHIPLNRNGRFLTDMLYAEDADTEEYKAKVNKCYKKLYRFLEKHENVILTEESIWHACKRIDNFWEDFNEKIISRGHKLKVIVYLRRQDEFIQSYYKFKVLKDETCGFMEYIKSSKYSFFPLDYNTHLSWIAKKTGRENIIVRVYESGQYEGSENSIISDFLHTIGLTLTDEYEQRNELMNTNVDFICTEIKRILNSVPEFHDRRSYIRKYMSMLTKKNKMEGKYQFKSLFMPSEQDEFLKRFEEENYRVASEWLGREDGRLFYAPVSYDDTEKAFSAVDYVNACGEIISMLGKENMEIEDKINLCKQELNEKS